MPRKVIDCGDQCLTVTADHTKLGKLARRMRRDTMVASHPTRRALAD